MGSSNRAPQLADQYFSKPSPMGLTGMIAHVSGSQSIAARTSAFTSGTNGSSRTKRPSNGSKGIGHFFDLSAAFGIIS
jgi:hypothetical protein